MTVIWSGITEEGAIVPVQVTDEGKVVATSGGGLEGAGATAWGSFKGSPLALVSGLGISSITRTSKGTYRVEFTTPLPNNTYAVLVTVNDRIGSASSPDKNGFTMNVMAKSNGDSGDPKEEGPNSVLVFCDGIASSSGNLASRLDDIREGIAEEAEQPTALPSFPDNESQVIVTPDNDNAS
jgi:hypothetical protein